MKEVNLRPTWDEYFMFSAYSSATRSSCCKLKTGAVVVKDKRIIASGYNGAPPGIRNCLEVGCRKFRCNVSFEDKGKSVCRGSHAEINAVEQIARENLKGSSLYTVYFPCSSCAKAIVGGGLSEVVFSKEYSEPDSLTLELFQEANIPIRHFQFNIHEYCERIRQLSEL